MGAAACSGEDAVVDAGVEATDTGPEPRIDPDLIGRWEGTIEGSLGRANAVARLRSGGSFVGEGTGLYCPLSGTWHVTDDDDVVLTGTDECDGTRLTLTAPRDPMRLEGTWRASSGNSGTFDLTKQ